MSLCAQSRAGSASLGDPEERAEIRGEMKSSDSERERERRGPGRESEEVGEEGEEGGGGEEIRSMRDLHWWESLDWPLRQDAAFFMIFSRVGTRIRVSGESGEVGGEDILEGGGLVFFRSGFWECDGGWIG